MWQSHVVEVTGSVERVRRVSATLEVSSGKDLVGGGDSALSNGWIWVFSEILSISAASGRFRQTPVMSRTFSVKAGSVLMLKYSKT